MKNFSLFTITITVAMLISGFAYYFAAPLNWGAGEWILDFHLWIGIFFTIYLIYALPRHVKNAKPKAKRAAFINLSYLMMLFLGVAFLSGLAHFIPYISYFIKPIYYRFETYDVISNIHLISASMLALLFLLHLSIKYKGNR